MFTHADKRVPYCRANDLAVRTNVFELSWLDIDGENPFFRLLAICKNFDIRMGHLEHSVVYGYSAPGADPASQDKFITIIPSADEPDKCEFSSAVGQHYRKPVSAGGKDPLDRAKHGRKHAVSEVAKGG